MHIRFDETSTSSVGRSRFFVLQLSPLLIPFPHSRINGELERIVIRKECFVVTKNWIDIKNAPSDGTFRNAIFPKLKFVHTGDYSFGDYHSFTLENLPSLYFLHMGYRCFFQCPSFSLTGWNPWSDIQCRTSLTPLCVVWLCRLCILSCCYI